MEEEEESAISNCSSISEIRRVAKENPSLKEALLDSVSPAKATLASVTQRLRLKSKQFAVDIAAREEGISELWNKIDPDFNIGFTEKVSAKCLTPKLQEFIYFFEIKKCGQSTCEVCTPIRMPFEEFSKIKTFPDPV